MLQSHEKVYTVALNDYFLYICHKSITFFSLWPTFLSYCISLLFSMLFNYWETSIAKTVWWRCNYEVWKWLKWLWLQSFSFIWDQELNILSSCDNGINVFFQVYKKNRRTFIQDNDPITLLSQGNDCYPEDNEIINSAQIKLLQPRPFLASVEDYITHFNLNICCHNILCTKIFCTHPLDEYIYWL